MFVLKLLIKKGNTFLYSDIAWNKYFLFYHRFSFIDSSCTPCRYWNYDDIKASISNLRAAEATRISWAAALQSLTPRICYAD